MHPPVHGCIHQTKRRLLHPYTFEMGSPHHPAPRIRTQHHDVWNQQYRTDQGIWKRLYKVRKFGIPWYVAHPSDWKYTPWRRSDRVPGRSNGEVSGYVCGFGKETWGLRLGGVGTQGEDSVWEVGFWFHYLICVMKMMLISHVAWITFSKLRLTWRNWVCHGWVMLNRLLEGLRQFELPLLFGDEFMIYKN